MMIKKLIVATVLSVGLIHGAVAEIAVEQKPREEQGVLPLDELRTFANVFQQIRSGYVKEVSDSQLLEYAIDGMLMNLDPHSAFLTGDAYGKLQDATHGEFSGLGIEVGMEGGYVIIVSPIDDTPAARAGLQSGDVILQIDGKSLQGESLGDAIKLMRGPKGSDITLQIGRPGSTQPFDVTLTRATIRTVSVRSRVLEPGYGYLRVAQFQTRTGADAADKLKKLLKNNKPLHGLILDLRNNPGGVMSAAVDVANLFLANGMIVYTDGRLEQVKQRYEADGEDLSDGVPMVVLVNGGSASASEIVAGALQDHHRAVVMGTQSFGKGSVQTVLPISKDRAVKLTTSLYFTPNGRSIQAEGIVPDVIVPPAEVTPAKTRRRIKENDLSGRLDNGNHKKSAAKKSDVVAELLQEDNQLAMALTLLKGLAIANRTAQESVKKQ